MFEFLGKREKPDTAATVEANPSPGESGDASFGLRVENSESAKTLRAAKSKGGAKPESGSGTPLLEDRNATTLAEQAKVLEALLDPKVWKGAVAAPGDAMHALTGKEYWELSDEEKDTLAKTGAATARSFMVTDPKWLALSLFAFSVLSIYGSRMMKDLQERKQAKTNPSPVAQGDS